MEEYKKKQIEFCRALLTLCKEHNLEILSAEFQQKIEDHSVTNPMAILYKDKELQTKELLTKVYK